MYICSAFFGNMAIVSFFTALVLQYFPTSTGSYLLSIGPTLENVLQFCSFSTFRCLYFMLLYMGHYGILALLLIMAVLFVQFTGEPLTFSNFWSSDTLFGISVTFEFMLVDLFNMFLSLPGNILCFIPQFQTLMIQVFVKDWHGKTNIFLLPKNATASDLRKQISIKFKLSCSHYWLNGPQGHNLENHQELHNLDTIHIRGRLFGGTNMCCIKGCSEEASNRNIFCLAGVYELKIPPHILRQASDLCNLYICNHHYYFHQKRGHKPRRLYSSVEYAKKILLSNKSELNDYSTSLDVKTCTLCKKNVVVTTKTPCLQHTLSLSSQNFMCACNCLDETIDGKIQNMKIEMYDCIASKAESLSRKSDLVEGYICTECGPTHLHSLEKGSARETESLTTINETHQFSFPFSEAFAGSEHCNLESTNNSILINYESIYDTFLLTSKGEFAPWNIYLQHGRTGVMLHFYLERSAEMLATKNITLFCPFLFGAPYQISFSVYVLGKQVDSGFLPNKYFQSDRQAMHTMHNILNSLFSVQLCLGIYDERILNMTKVRELKITDPAKGYEIDTKFVLTNHHGKEVRETIRSTHSERPL